MTNLKNCICCHKDLSNKKYLFTKQSAKYYKCLNCGHIFQDPQPDDFSIKDMYDDYDYQKSYINTKTFYTKAAAKYLRTILRDLPDINLALQKMNIKLLDVGCSIGLFLNIAKSIGFQAEGTDISELAAKFALENFGVNVKPGNFLEIDFQKESYDIITMFQILEHLIDPDPYLNKIKELLKPGGYLCIATPDTNTIFQKLYKKHWGIYTPDLHISLFNNENIKTLLGFHMYNIIKSQSIHETDIFSEQFEYFKFLTVRLIKNFIISTKIFKPLISKKLLKEWSKQREMSIPLPCLNYSVFTIVQKPLN